MEPDLKGPPRRGRLKRRLAATAAAALVAVGATVYMSATTQAQTPAAEGEYDEAAIRLGFQVWKDKVWCGQCHGWNGNGLPDDPRAPVGANLRETLLAPEQMYTMIQCGVIGTEMPAFDARAYVDDRCFGLTREQLGADTPPAHGVYLIPREINGLIAYIFTNIVGRGPFTDEECRAYYGEEAAICDTLTAGGVAQPPQATPP